MTPLAGNRLFAIGAWIGAVVLGFVAGRYLSGGSPSTIASDLPFVMALAALVTLMGAVHAFAVMRIVTRLLDLRDTLDRIVNRIQKDGGAR